MINHPFCVKEMTRFKAVKEINRLKFKHDLLKLFYQEAGHGFDHLDEIDKYVILETILTEIREGKPHYLQSAMKDEE